jgi:hypothetical protein
MQERVVVSENKISKGYLKPYQISILLTSPALRKWFWKIRKNRLAEKRVLG